MNSNTHESYPLNTKNSQSRPHRRRRATRGLPRAQHEQSCGGLCSPAAPHARARAGAVWKKKRCERAERGSRQRGSGKGEGGAG
ncbi:hypothetical protein BC830DRAFT_1142330 [Chytriomyces sp. MP71]|nr:hypothetical protein BC830DRAFT_1142330 [Chytriomyces sp. MP71]